MLFSPGNWYCLSCVITRARRFLCRRRKNETQDLFIPYKERAIKFKSVLPLIIGLLFLDGLMALLGVQRAELPPVRTKLSVSGLLRQPNFLFMRTNRLHPRLFPGMWRRKAMIRCRRVSNCQPNIPSPVALRMKPDGRFRESQSRPFGKQVTSSSGARAATRWLRRRSFGTGAFQFLGEYQRSASLRQAQDAA